MEIPLGNSTLKKQASTSPVTTVTRHINPDSMMRQENKQCSLEVCAKQHLYVLIAVAGLYLFLLIITFLCIKCFCNHGSRNSGHDDTKENNAKISTLEETHDERPSITKPLPAPPSSSRPAQPTSKYSHNPAYLEIISDDRHSYSIEQQSVADRNQKTTTGSVRALIPDPSQRYRPSIPRASPRTSNRTYMNITASYLEPREGEDNSPYAELRFQKRKSRADSVSKTKGYTGLNSLTRIRAKISRARKNDADAGR